MTAPAPNMLKCPYCHYQTLRFRTLKNGRVRHGHGTLEHHVEQAHRQEIDVIVAQVQADFYAAPDTCEGEGDVGLGQY